MKKRILTIMVLAITSFAAHAQLDFSQLRVELAGNYTMYKGDFQQKTPGAKFRVSLPVSEKAAAGLGFTYHLPVKVPSTVLISGGGSTASEVVYNFKTITLDANYFFGGEKSEGFTAYGTGGASFILVSYKENITGTIPAGQEATDLLAKASLSGFGINLGLGAQYSLGKPKIFGEAGIALPANKVQNQYVSNPIPAHLTFNVGIRFALGEAE
jgi:opacity protein-like surface antigen